MNKLFKHAGSDLSAALVVFLVALPLCLGIALASNAPPFSGLIAGFVGGIVIGILSGSQLSVSGPAAGLATIVAGGIAKLPSYEVFLAAVVVAGIIQIILGFVKAGVIGDYVPFCVIKGMLAAIGLILILKQFPHLVGYDKDFEGDESFMQKNNENTFSGIFNAFRNIAPAAVVIGVLGLLVQVLWDKVLVKKAKIFQFIPSPLVVVAIGLGINAYLVNSGMPQALKGDHVVNIPVATSLDSFLSFFIFPDFSGIANYQFFVLAFTIAIVASLETLLNIEAADELDPYQRVTPRNRELQAQGVGNIISGLIGGLPLTSVVVRTSANVNAGAKTKLAAIVHGMLLLLSVLFIPAVLNLIPNAALAAILIYTGYKLAKPSLFTMFYRRGLDQFIPFVVTIVAILLTDLLIGIMIGIVVGLFFILRSNFKRSVFIVNDENRYLFRLRKDVSFLNKSILRNKLEEVPRDSFVMIDATRADFIDKDIINVINDFLKHAHLKGIRVEIKKNQHKPVHQLLEEQYGLIAQ